MATPRKFNPGLNQDSQNLIAQYVIRLPLLDMLLEKITENTTAPICQHLLYYGPRGRGKTMLLARIEAELITNTDFSKNWIPIRIQEESYYEIASEAEFWLEVLIEMAKHWESVSDSEVDIDIDQTIKHINDNWNHPDKAIITKNAVLEILEASDKKALIMVENLNQLLSEADNDFGWSIRRTMQNEPSIMFLATATSYFNQLSDAKSPFFEIFAVAELRALTKKEATILWNAITKEVKTEDEISPLLILTGGSPRLLNIVAQFSGTNSIRDLMENLAGLIDEYTEYFKSQIDALGPKERRVFLALADLWKESTAKEIADRARMDIRTTSSLLGRLENKGALNVRFYNKSKKGYLIAERLFCIYYKLRKQRTESAILENLIKFMIDFYTPTQISEIKESYIKKDELDNIERQFLTHLQDSTGNGLLADQKIQHEFADTSSTKDPDLSSSTLLSNYLEIIELIPQKDYSKCLVSRPLKTH